MKSPHHPRCPQTRMTPLERALVRHLLRDGSIEQAAACLGLSSEEIDGICRTLQQRFHVETRHAALVCALFWGVML